jgi:molybdate transport system substrate-binding protein
MRSKTHFLVGLLAALLAACGDGGEPRWPPVVVFAAASLREVAADLGRDFERRHGAEVVFNFAGSNTLAQQIDAAPRADVFLSADPQWVDFLAASGRTVPGWRRDFLSNRLVLVARRDSDLEIGDPRDLAAADYRFLAVADPDAVPAGRYARAYLERLSAGPADLWTAVAGRLVPTLDVRAALALVESDPEILGVVYETDALTSPKVRLLYRFPTLDDVPITYCAALLAGGENPELGRRFLDFLDSPAGREIAERHGFETRAGESRRPRRPP